MKLFGAVLFFQMPIDIKKNYKKNLLKQQMKDVEEKKEILFLKGAR